VGWGFFALLKGFDPDPGSHVLGWALEPIASDVLDNVVATHAQGAAWDV